MSHTWEIFKDSLLLKRWSDGHLWQLTRCRRSDQAHFNFYTELHEDLPAVRDPGRGGPSNGSRASSEMDGEGGGGGSLFPPASQEDPSGGCGTTAPTTYLLEVVVASLPNPPPLPRAGCSSRGQQRH